MENICEFININYIIKTQAESGKKGNPSTYYQVGKVKTTVYLQAFHIPLTHVTRDNGMLYLEPQKVLPYLT